MRGRWCTTLLLMIAFSFVMADGGWEKFLADAQNSGRSTGLNGPSGALCIQTNATWNANTTHSSPPIDSGPLVTADNLLFYSTSDSSSSTLNKVNLTTGDLVWSYTTQFRFRSHLLRSNNVIWVGLDYCQVAAIQDQGTQTVVHTTTTIANCHGPFVGGLALSSSGEMILARNMNGDIYGISTQIPPEVKWHAIPQSDADISSLGTLMIDPNRTNTAWMGTGNSLFWVDTNTGAISSPPNSTIPDTITSSLVTASGLSNGYLTTIRNQIYAFDMQNGTIRWFDASRTQTSGTNSHCPPPAISADGQRVYAILDYSFYAYNATDKAILYNISLASSFLRMPLWLNVDALDQVFFPMNGLLYSIDGPTGTILSQTPLPGSPEAWDVSVLVANGGVIVQTPTAVSFYGDANCPASSGAGSSPGDYVWIVTGIFCFFIVVFTILAVGEALRTFRNRKYARIADSTI